MSNPLKILTYLTASKDAYFEETVNISGAVTAQNSVTVSGGDLNVSAGNISGSGTLQVGSNATVGGNLTVQGDFTVNGTTTIINTETVIIEDKNIVLASGSVSDVTADGGGISLSGSTIKTFNWVDATDSWTSSENMDLAAGKTYKLDTLDVLTKNGSQLQVGADAGITSVMLDNATDLFVSGNMRLSGATDFSYISAAPYNVSRTDGLYDVDQAIQALDQAVSESFQQGGANTNAIKAAYNDLRAVVTGTLNGSGYVEVDLTNNYSTASFAVGEIKNVAVDVMIDTNDDGVLTNDLTAVRLFVSASALWISVDAPATPSVPYRIIVVNEKDNGLGTV